MYIIVFWLAFYIECLLYYFSVMLRVKTVVFLNRIDIESTIMMP